MLIVEPEFEMPEYLSTVLKGNLIESAWWPTFSRSPPKSDADDLNFDFTSMKLDELPSREDIKGMWKVNLLFYSSPPLEQSLVGTKLQYSLQKA